MRKLLLLLVLTSCAGQTVYTPQEVDVPVETKCIVPLPPKPQAPTSLLVDTTPWTDKLDSDLAQLDIDQAYQVQLEAALKACQ